MIATVLRVAGATLTAAAMAAVGLSVPAHASGYEGKVIARAGLVVRSAPSTRATRMGGLADGEAIGLSCKSPGTTVNGNNRWYRLSGKNAWVSARYVANVGAAPGWCGSSTSTSTASSTGGSSTAVRWCTTANLDASARTERGGGSAGHQTVWVRITNTGRQPCRTQGYPGVSLVGHGNGTQLGAAADRFPASTPSIVLKPGNSAQAAVLVAEAGNYLAATCHRTTADGFRVYPPDERLALYAPYRVAACGAAQVHQLQVKPFEPVA